MAQSQLLVPEALRDRADALALVLDTSRADIWRKAIEGAGLVAVETQYADALKRLDPIADRFGMTRTEMAARAVRDRWTLAELEGKKRYPGPKKA